MRSKPGGNAVIQNQDLIGTLYGGDGVTTFALPTAEDVIYAAGNGRAVGAAVADGLPEIQGEIDTRPDVVTASGGAFVTNVVPISSMYFVALGSTDQKQVEISQFNASRYNSIYGASEHVQPKGTAFNFCIIYE